MADLEKGTRAPWGNQVSEKEGSPKEGIEGITRKSEREENERLSSVLLNGEPRTCTDYTGAREEGRRKGGRATSSE